MTNYYIDPVSGNDSYNGLSGTWTSGLNGPWSTIAHAMSVLGFVAGDQLLFKSGTTSNSDTGLYTFDNGTAANPIVFGIYGGATKATINISDVTVGDKWPKVAVLISASHIRVENLALSAVIHESYRAFAVVIDVAADATDVEISNCEVTASTDASVGIFVHDSPAGALNLNIHDTVVIGPDQYATDSSVGINIITPTDGVNVSNILLENNTVYNFQDGISLWGGYLGSLPAHGSFDANILIDGCIVHHCSRYGISIAEDNTQYPTYKGATAGEICNCKIYNMLAVEDAVDFGIFISGSSNIVIHDCVCHDFGTRSYDCVSVAYSVNYSSYITVKQCEAYSMFTKAGAIAEGAGLIFDMGTTYSVCECNYFHDCDGVGLAIGTDGVSATTHNDARNNIVQRVALVRSGDTPGISIYNVTNDVSKLTDITVYNNTVYQTTPESGVSLCCLGVWKSTNVTVKNNIFVNSVAGQHVAAIYSGSTNLVCDYNLYYGTSNYDPLTDTTYTVFSDFKSAFGEAHGIGFATSPLLSDPGNAPTYNDPLILSNAGFYYNLQTGSSCLNAGVAVGLTYDFMHQIIHGLPDIGAVEQMRTQFTMPFTP